MKMVFIRHSKSLVNPNIPITSWGLSEEGRILAKKLNSLSQIKTIEVIYSSLQPKALETAALATENLGIQIKTDNNLTESTSFTNKFVSLKELEENTRKYYAEKILSIHGGETFVQAQERFAKALEEIVKKEQGKENIGIVSHGNILAGFVSQITRTDPFEIVEKIAQPDVAVFDWDRKQFVRFFGGIQGVLKKGEV